MVLHEEIIINAIEKTLQDNMVATLADAEQSAGDNLQLDDIAEYHKGLVLLLNCKNYPVIGIHAVSTRLEGAGYHCYDGYFTFDILIAVTDHNEETLFKKINRYPEVVREIIQRNPTLQDNCTDTEITNIEYIPATTGLSVASITIEVRAEIR